MAGAGSGDSSMITRGLASLAALSCPLLSCTGPGGDAPQGQEGTEGGGVRAILTCQAPTGMLGPGASLDGRAGEYSLTLVAHAAAADPRWVRGNLVLHEQGAGLRRFAGSDGAIPRVGAPLFGSTDVRVEAVGALRVGDLSSMDPAAPGVLVIESETDQGPSILVRFGSAANRRDMVDFDGGFTVLEVREIGSDRFSGVWTSGVRAPETRGHFCAELRSPAAPVAR